MPGFLLNVSSVVICAHGGQAKPTVPNPRVKVMGQPVVTQVVHHMSLLVVRILPLQLMLVLV